VRRQQLQESKKTLKAERTDAGRTLVQNRQSIGFEKSPDVLEEIPSPRKRGLNALRWRS